jgi:transposase
MTHSERVKRRQEMAEAVHNGSTLGEAASEFEVSMTTVRMAHQQFYPGEKARKGTPRASSTVKIIALLVKTHLTLKEIADLCGVKYQRIQELQQELQNEGIHRSSP